MSLTSKRRRLRSAEEKIRRGLNVVARVKPRNRMKVYRDFRYNTEDAIIERFFHALDCPRSLTCYMLWKYDEHRQLAELQWNPEHYDSVESVRDSLAATSFLQKYPLLKTGISKRDVALSKFNEAEQKCKQTNLAWRNGFNLEIFASPGYATVYEDMRCEINRILGHISAKEIFDNGRFGPGVTTLIKGDDTSASLKYDAEDRITPDAHALFLNPLRSYAGYRWHTLESTVNEEGSRIVTVPKNAKTDRTIGIEPGLNVWLQLGIGRVIRSRLLRAGVDLNDDTSNKEGAFYGSIDGSLSTIDKRQASDTISREVVRALIEPRWFTILDRARSPSFTLDGKTWRRFEKFSSMGNGFTFELESLIFYCAARACVRRTGEDVRLVSVFGDDIVIPTKAAAVYRHFVTLLGFEVNVEKTFTAGYFRESCGSYYYDGVDVKPLFKRRVTRRTFDVFSTLNGIRTLAHRFSKTGCDKRFQPLWNHLFFSLPPALRVVGPLEAGDATIAENRTNQPLHPDGWEAWLYSGFPTVPKTVEHDGYGHLLALLRRSSASGGVNSPVFDGGNTVPLRGRTKYIFKSEMYSRQWCDLGPWSN